MCEESEAVWNQLVLNQLDKGVLNVKTTIGLPQQQYTVSQLDGGCSKNLDKLLLITMTYNALLLVGDHNWE